MDNAGYTTLTRQSGLMREMQIVANNMANLSTAGFRREGVMFSEYVERLDGDAPSLSMAAARGRITSPIQGALIETGATFDLAIEGDGFFMVETPGGPALTRAGAFTPSADGELVTPDGHRVLDAGGAPVFVPAGSADVAISADGTVSADGQPLGQIGLWQVPPETRIDRRDGVLFTPEAAPEPMVENAGRILQGFTEKSNVNPVTEIARMIQVQRAYELGQNFLENEDQRIRNVLTTLGK